MAKAPQLIIMRMAPVALVTAAALAYVMHVEGPDSFAIRNALPMMIVLVLSAITLYRGHGSWIGSGWRWPLGTLGFAIPALGLSLYLHYGYTIDLNGMFSDAENPEAVFRFLPIYTVVAGGIGFAIGWIIGRNI